MTPNPYLQYRAAAVQTATPVDLVLQLYKGVVRFTLQAIQAMEQRDVQQTHDAFLRAQDIIIELISTLNVEEGGDIARQLAAIYDYAHRRLVESNARKDARPAREVLNIFRELGSAWHQIAQAQRQAQAAAPAAPAGVPVGVAR